ncbi:MAG TPA: type II toxin-antitoxin system RelE/ParE family toxin [Pirellulales bacterium]|nr:type II toxin-antitoxin system RelE/ParE family toxin [Pirellulales bacterium]
MEVEHLSQELERLETEAGFNAGFSAAIVAGYHKVMRFIRAAKDERDFRAMRSLNFEKLKGSRSHQHSMRINQQWRLILELKQANPKNVVVVVAIEDYH